MPERSTIPLHEVTRPEHLPHILPAETVSALGGDHVVTTQLVALTNIPPQFGVDGQLLDDVYTRADLTRELAQAIFFDIGVQFGLAARAASPDLGDEETISDEALEAQANAAFAAFVEAGVILPNLMPLPHRRTADQAVEPTYVIHPHLPTIVENLMMQDEVEMEL